MRPEIAGNYNERFKRMFSYYLNACAGAFRARDIQLWQVVFTRGVENGLRVLAIISRISCGESYFPLANVGLISDHIFSCSQYAFYGIDNRLRLRIDLDIHTLTQFFLPSVVRSSVSGMRCTQKRVGVTSPTVKLMPSTPIKPLYRIYFIRDASCTLNHT